MVVIILLCVLHLTHDVQVFSDAERRDQAWHRCGIEELCRAALSSVSSLLPSGLQSPDNRTVQEVLTKLGFPKIAVGWAIDEATKEAGKVEDGGTYLLEDSLQLLLAVCYIAIHESHCSCSPVCPAVALLACAHVQRLLSWGHTSEAVCLQDDVLEKSRHTIEHEYRKLCRTARERGAAHPGEVGSVTTEDAWKWVEEQAGTTFTGDDINMVLQVCLR